MSERTPNKSTSEENRRVATSQAKPDASSAHAEDRFAKGSSGSSIKDKNNLVGNSEFQLKLLGSLIQDFYKFQPNNTDFWISGMGMPGRIDGITGLLREVPVQEPHAAPVSQIDGRNQLHIVQLVKD